jgi:hypothetical protein
VRDKVEALTPGQKVKVKGRCKGQGDGFIVQSAIVTEVGPDPAVPVSATQLTQDYAKGAAAADKKFKGKTLIVEGVIADLGKTPDSGLGSQPIIFLLGFDEKSLKAARVEAVLRDTDPKPVAGLAKGQKVKVKGECVGKMGDNVALRFVKVVK